MTDPIRQTRPYVIRIESNVKGGVDCELGPKTLIVGPTGSGKSAVANAVELALSGRASDIMGREDVGKESVLMALAPGRGGRLFAHALLSDGSKALWETSATARGSAKQAEHVVPAGVDPTRVFPLRAIGDALASEPDKARRYFLRQIAGSVADTDIEALIPAPLLPLYRSTLVAAAPTDSPIDRLLLAAESARAAVVRERTAAKAAKAQADASGQGLPPPATEQQLVAAREALEQARAAYGAAAAADGAARTLGSEQGRRDRAQQEAREAQAAIQAADQAMAQLQKRRGAAEAEVDRLTREIDSLPNGTVPEHVSALLKILAAQCSGRFELSDVCACCGSVVPGGVEALQHRMEFLHRVAATGQQARDARAALAERREAAESGLSEIRKVLDTVRQKNDLDARRLRDLHEYLGSQAELALPSESAKLALAQAAEGAKRALAEAERVASALHAQGAAWTAANRARDAAVEAEGRQADWAQLAAACSSAVERLLDSNVSALRRRVRARLSPSHDFDLMLRDGTRAVFQAGFLRAGLSPTLSDTAPALLSALSGGEWAQMTVALADACAPDEGPSIIVPLDRQMDATALAAALAAWSNCESQVIATSVVEPESVPAGWTVIRTLPRAQPEPKSAEPRPAEPQAEPQSTEPQAEPAQKAKRTRKKKVVAETATGQPASLPPGAGPAPAPATTVEDAVAGTAVPAVPALAQEVTTSSGRRLRLYDVEPPTGAPGYDPAAPMV